MAKEKELVGSNGDSRNWKGIVISLLVIFAVLGIICLAVYIQKQKNVINLEQKPFTLNDVMNIGDFDPKLFTGTWINDDTFTYQNEQLNIMMFECKSMKETLIMSNNTIKQLVGENIKHYMSGDPSIILFSYDTKLIHRHSGLSRYRIFNTISNMSFDVVPTHLYSSDQIQLAVLSPNSRSLAYVYQNNIYFMAKYFDGLKESTQITIDGKDKLVYNGIADWLYEEEILSDSKAMWWSPDSLKLAFIKFNDSQVEFYSFPIYDESQYGAFNTIRYPKTDTKNPTASVFIYNTQIGDTLKLKLPESLQQEFSGDFYIWNVKWLRDDRIIVVYVNREQNRANTVINDATTGNVLLSKFYPSAPLSNYDGWFLPQDLLTTSRYNYYFQIWPYQGFKNIISFDITSGDGSPATIHEFDVMKIVSFNEKQGEIYYLATNGDPKQRHLFKKRVTDVNSHPICLTCNSSIKIDHTDPFENSVDLGSTDHCLYYSAVFSLNSEYYALECLGDRIPIVWLKDSRNESVEFVFEKNDHLRQMVQKKILPRKGYLRVTLENTTTSVSYADAEILLPPQLKISENTYPVLIYVYNGPSSQTVDYQFRIRKFESYLCINYGIVIAILDGRGTDGQGDKFLKAVSKKLGQLETNDQIELAKALQKEVYTSDPRFAIWGWSYGGFLSAMALFQDHSPFKCAVSGAPVTDWLFYDSAYTERHMGTYAQNRMGYEKSNLTNIAKLNSRFLDAKQMLLIHGTGDDNVHFQNSAVLAKVLRNSNIDLEFEIYPDMPHTPNVEIQRQLYQKITKFLLNCYNINYHSYYEQLSYHHLMTVE